MTDIVERLVVDDTSGMRQYEREARTVLHSLLSEAAEVIQTLRKDLEESKASDTTLRALSGAHERAEALEAKVAQLEESLTWWRDSETEMRRQRDRLKKLFSWLVERQIQKERQLERRHAAELSDMRAMVRGYRAALGEGEL